MIILGIDPGTVRIGYALLNKDGGAASLIAFGCLELGDFKEQAGRLKALSGLIYNLIRSHRPEIMAIEKLFFGKNAKTALSVAEARGVIINSAASLNLQILELHPLQIKTAVAGSGSADKKQVQKMICQLLKLPKVPEPDDAADAIAIGLAACYINQNLIK